MSAERNLYHHTHSLSLPSIMLDGALKPLDTSTLDATKFGLKRGSNIEKAPEYVHATSDPEGDGTSTLGYVARQAPELDHIRVRFTLHREDFKPWREVVEAEPLYDRDFINALVKSAHAAKTNPISWFVSKENIPLERVKAIHFKSKCDGDWREFEHPWRFVAEVDSEILGVDFGSRGNYDTNFFEWSKSFVNESGQSGKLAMYRTLSRDTYQALFATGWKGPQEPPQDCPDPYKYQTYELRTASLPEAVVKKLDKAFPLTRYNGKIDAVEARPLLGDDDDLTGLDKVIASFKPKKLSTVNAEIMTTPIRFQIDTDLFKQYLPEEVEEDKALLIAEGRWHLPNEGGRYTLRFAYGDVPEAFGFPIDLTANWLGTEVVTRKFGPGNGGKGSLKDNADVEMFIDFDMEGDKLIRTTDVLRRKVREKFLTYERKAEVIADPERFGIRASGTANGYIYDSSSIWWEKNDWVCQRCKYDDRPPAMGEDANLAHPLIAAALRDVLVLSLMDRNTVKAEPPRYDRNKPMQRPGPYSPEQEVKEVVIYCPGRISNADGTTSRASPKMHRRRGHPRTIHRGTDKQRTLYIEPMWINAADTDTSTLPEPPRNFIVRT
jgi:hypothetical protein